MRYFLFALALLFALPTKAESDIEQGTGLICDTKSQMERFISLKNNGTELEEAIQAVNFEEQKESACGMAMIAYKRIETVGEAEVDNTSVLIVRIEVVAMSNGMFWLPISDYEQFTIIVDQKKAGQAL